MATTNTSQPGDTSESPDIIKFTYGLNGVNLPLNDESSGSLYALIGLLCLFIIVVRLLQLGNAYLRKVTTLTSTPAQQRYWSENPTTWWPWLKRNLIWAPLRHKRHHHEIQLSSAINIGTIPSRLQTLLLSIFFISQLTYMLLLDFSKSQPQITAELRGRSGHLSVLNMMMLFLFAGRNNPLIRILRVSFDTFNLFHRWIGRVVIIEAIIHTFAWGANKYLAGGTDSIAESLHESAFLQYGLVAVVAMVIIMVQAPSAVRHAFYEIFLHLHQLLAFLALLGIFMHAKLGSLPQTPFVTVIVLLWCWDRVARVVRLVYYNVSWRHGMSRATVEALPGETCRVTFQMPRKWTPPAGAHVYAYLPTVSFWQSHPFSIAWSAPTSSLPASFATSRSSSDYSTLDAEKGDDAPVSVFRNGTSVSLVMLARTGMTRKLYERAWAQPRHRLQVVGLLEGPYGALESLSSYGTVVLFAGGIGITHQLPLLRDLLRQYDRQTGAARRVTLVWSVRTIEALEWVRPFMDELLRMPGRRDVLRIKIFVTRPKDQRDVVSASDRVQMMVGRVDPATIIRHEFQDRVGAMVVGVCGPGVFADEVRKGARGVVDEGKVDFWEEGFTW